MFVNNELLATYISSRPSAAVTSPTSLLLGKSGISVNLQTGEVTIPPDLTISDAAREFWQAVQCLCPNAPEGNRGFGT
jgi:hypothetical protein